MNPNHLAAYRILEQAQKLRASNPKAARAYAIQSAQMAPDLEEPWLMLAAVSSPRASVAYLHKALEINPQSERARKGMVWAVKRLREYQVAHPPKLVPTTPVIQAGPKAAHPRVSYAILLLFLLCLVGGILAIWQVSPVVAAIGNRVFAVAPASELNPDQNGGAAWAQVDLPKPTYTLTSTITSTSTDTPTPTDTFTPSPAATWTLPATATDTETPFPSETPLPPDTETPFPTAGVVSPTEIPSLPPTAPVSNGGERWVEVNLTQQMLYAWEGDVLVGSFVVSTGTWQYPTVTGSYRVWARFKYKDMSGPGYYLPDVPNTMFFYQGYAIHGTYWHNNFGTPMSHGCVNMTIPDSEWLFNWAPKDLLVNVHY